MAQKLWEKSVQVNKDIERFTVGRDREMDLYLSLIHIYIEEGRLFLNGFSSKEFETHDIA